MPVTPSYLTFVLDQLAAFGDVTSKRMFGGVGLYYDAAIFGLIDGDVVFFKVDDASRPEFEQRAMPAFRPVASKPDMVSKNYYQLPDEVLEDPELLTVWAGRAVAAARTKAKASRARSQPSAAKPGLPTRAGAQRAEKKARKDGHAQTKR